MVARGKLTKHILQLLTSPGEEEREKEGKLVSERERERKWERGGESRTNKSPSCKICHMQIEKIIFSRIAVVVVDNRINIQ